MANEFKDLNDGVIKEFRANGGEVSEPTLKAYDLLLLTTTGAKSGEKRVNPLAYAGEAGRLYVFASYAGNPKNPPWYYNLLANPEVEVEVGNDKFNATATIVPEPERTDIYNQMASRGENFVAYQEKTDRVIPVVALHRI
jgi:deazaflavin-dependent oxidoreductase (nitroreductase family)